MGKNTNDTLLQKHELDIGTVYFYNNYVIVEIKKGIVLNFEKAAPLFMLGKQYYGNKTPFVYISNRINSYSFEPTSHFKSAELFPNLKGVAVVTYNAVNENVARLEQAFLDKPAQIFHSLDEAIEWVNEIIISD
ncbi:hypothetical protein [Aquimarina algicola]|uniref:STAS/SEC14 domain-containing protein n=1 Tax=Aquimarina algicola TaxID=2589995 RepID=A0A504J807_9FLAO|nr:hypothetical protein [Aquimarina algicola]TPN84725.1 hypothetical protein FHK87_17510 [Aquimarina algicola]